MGSGDLATLVRICDPAGRPRGTGFLADHHGTVVTSHEAVDGLSRVVLHAPGDRTWLAEAEAVTPLPESGLALVRTEGLGGRPLPLATRPEIEPGTYVRIAAQGWREARVLGPASVTYTATDRFHALADALELAIGTEGADALRRGGQAAGGPVLDTVTGTVLAVLGTALRGDRQAAGYAVPLRPAGPLTALLRRNAATVPAYGPDLNLAAILELTATSTGPVREPDPWPEPVERPDCVREFARFTAGDNPVLALVGAPGTGRTTALAALCARRARGVAPAPTVRLRGADLRAEDHSLADAVGRALHEAGRIVAASGALGDTTTATPERAAALARDAGRPLLVVLDGPEEMPPLLAHRLADWTTATEDWLRAHRVHLVTACRPEHWEQAGTLYTPGALHRPATDADDGLPAALALGPYSTTEARAVREGYGIGETDLAPADARHPLALRLLAEVRAALPGEVPGRPGREEIFTAYLDLVCLRAAVRIAAGSRPLLRGTAVRRLAARVTGRLHEAARRCLGPGHGVLDRASFEELFPWREGWAPAVLTEGLLVPAGSGYRFAHEELADWVQAAHLDLDTALDGLVHARHEDPPRSDPDTAAPGGSPVPGLPRQRPAGDAATAGQLPVPRHRIGPVLQALLLLHRERGPAGLAPRLAGLAEALARFAAEGDGGDGAWWAARLLREGVLRVPDPRPYLPVLRLLADHIGSLPGPHPVFASFGTAFWVGLPLGEDERIDLLRRLVPADLPPGSAALGAAAFGGAGAGGAASGGEVPGGAASGGEVPGGAGPRGEVPGGAGPRGEVPGGAGPRGEVPRRVRSLDAVAAMLVADPRSVQPLLCRWFGDPRPTVAAAAQALLHSHRALAVDDLCEALVATAHPLADGLLATLARDESSALCRAVDRWAHDDGRPERRVAAAAYGQLVAGHVTTSADRELLRYAALALLARPGDQTLHGAALGLLVRDPHSRARHLPRALAEPRVPAPALAEALATHPEEILIGFRARLIGTGEAPAAALLALAEVDTPALARRIAALVRDYAARHPEGAPHVAAFVDRRFEDGPAARAVLFPLVTGLIRGRPASLRRALAPVLAAPGTGASRHLRAELLDVLLEHERYEAETGELTVLEVLLRAAAEGAERRSAPRTRELVLRAGALCIRTPQGAWRLDRALAGAVREQPAFAALLAAWTVAAPGEWAPLFGPETLQALRSPGTAMPMRTDGRGHGSLRPA
ncbi:trypsin-like peptidase domain-containing protein [Streptomyces sp. NPDC002825]|uniref:trypsin-like peptidase domain-containing protein n=1 Tax=Streptomyces sp. NPDC002825 TaxID=3154666 RepID=UPI003324EC26